MSSHSGKHELANHFSALADDDNEPPSCRSFPSRSPPPPPWFRRPDRRRIPLLPRQQEMTLEEYEKVREEKRKAPLSTKVEERKVELDEDLKDMQQLSIKKGNDEVFIKLGSDKEFSLRRMLRRKNVGEMC